MAQTGIVTDLAEAIEKVEIMFASVIELPAGARDIDDITYMLCGSSPKPLVQAWYDCMLATMSRTTRQRLVWRKRPELASDGGIYGLMLISRQTME